MKQDERKPVQINLFEQHIVSVQWVAKHLRVSDDTVVRLIQEGRLRAYRLRLRSPYSIIKASVDEYEKGLLEQAGMQCEAAQK